MLLDFPAGRRFLWAAVAVGLLALGVRLLYLHEIEKSPLFDVPVVDAKTYVDDALYLSGESWAGRSAPFWQPPLYPYALALLFSAFGENYYLPRLVQAVLGAAVCVLLCFLGRRLFSSAISLGAGLAAAVYGPLIYFGGELLPPILAVFLDLLLLLFLIHLPGRGSGWGFLTGLLLGLSALAVANVLLFLPFLLLWLWHTSRSARCPGRRTVQQSAFLLLGCGLAITPVTLRNYLVGRDLVLISHNAGINFYLGNNPDSERTLNIRPGRDWARLVERPEREAGIERPSEKSRYFFARSWDFIAGQPLDYLQLLLRKLYHFWRGDEIRRNLDLYYGRHGSLLLSVLLWKHGLALPFGLVAPLALLGLVAFGRSPSGRTPQGRLLLLFLLVYMLSVVLFFVTSRYRLPVVPLLLLWAGWGVRECVVVRRKAALVAFPVLLVLTNAGAGPMDMEGAPQQHFWLGYAYEQKGMSANALREYRAALKRLPDHENSLLHLAALYGEQKQYTLAIELYQQFLRFYPESERVRFLLGNAHLQVHQHRQAIDLYEELLSSRPQWAELHGRLGYAYLMAGAPDQAAAAYRRTLELNPDSTVVRYQLARLYETEGDLDAAIAECRILLAQEPDRAEYHTRLADLLIEQEGAGRENILLDQTPRTHQAEAHLRRAISLDPDFVLSYWNLGLLLARQNRYIEAVEYFERIAQLTPLNAQVHACLGNLYERTGRKKKAEEHFARYTQLKQERRLQSRVRTEMKEQMEKIQKILEMLSR